MKGLHNSVFFAAICLLFVNIISAPNGLAQQENKQLPFRNPDLATDKRVDDLIGRMTVDEKIGQLMMATPAIPRLGVPAYHWWNEALHGLARTGYATVFPQAIGLGATWDVSLEQKIAEVISTEIRAKNNAVIAKGDGSTLIYQGLTIWSPNINIFRDPRWGRGQETYGEDPYLTGRFGVAFVRGLQGYDPHYLKTVATLKHFAVHSGPEELRHKFDAVISDRDLHETYLPAFEAGIREGHATSVMSAYNAIDGIPAPANSYLLQTTLRNRWGFDGAVVGDVDTVHDIFAPNAHHYVADAAEASALALKSGNDLCSGTAYSALPEALKRGLVTEAEMDQALHRLLKLRFELGQFDPADRVSYRKIPLREVDSPEHSQLALQASRESIVLLKNDGSLPWNPATVKHVAVLGPTADNHAALVGNYNGTPSHPVTILQGIRAKLEPKGIKVDYLSAVPLANGYAKTLDDLPAGTLFQDATASKPGLRGEVFENAEMNGAPQSVREDTWIDFKWRSYEPAAGLPMTDAHLRWSGILRMPTTGEIELGISFEGSARLYLDDVLIAGENNPGKPGTTETRTDKVRLEAGRNYPIRIEYNQTKGDGHGQIRFGWKPEEALASGIEMAKQADHIVLVLGITPTLEGEEMKVDADGFHGGDRTSIQLPLSQQELLDKVAELHKPFTVVLTGSSSLIFNVQKPNAILMAWYYGERGGEAVAEELLGETNPSGHLPVTFYSSDADLPPFTDYAMKNRTYRYFTGKPLYAFGYGLSYTSYTLCKTALSLKSAAATQNLSVTTEVTNTGTRTGDVVVEVYGRALHPPVVMPIRTLIGFERVPLAAGQTKTVVIPIKVESLRRWDEKSQSYLVDAGDYRIEVGQSSDDLPQSAILTVK